MSTRARIENFREPYLGIISIQHQRLRTDIQRALVEDLPHLNHGLKWVEEKIEVPKMHLLTGFVWTFLSVWTLLIWKAYCEGGNLITKLIGIIYPMHQSIRAIETQQSDIMNNWLAYWTVLGCFHIIEWILSDILLSWAPIHVPYFWILKSITLAVCMPTTLNGANYVYCKILQPTFWACENSEQKIKGKMTPKTTDKFSAKRK